MGGSYTASCSPEVLPATDAPFSPKRKVNPYVEERRERLATIYSAVHLLNPLVFSISTRGSSESVLSLLVLATLHAAMNERWDLAAVWLGLAHTGRYTQSSTSVSVLGALTQKKGAL
ncbi:hypothetical protein FA13DRAFT_1114435 [Coprinellus micaceus]|uniref:GPI mannosyltransferase 1 n=1 Tax=Coprinellus micaceus TaxID=71717 RepID=A0A4Y7RJT4_COPMI|nr:hypothetical protein FA13DRAFT_1114435 [Coprinellus micaceus]